MTWAEDVIAGYESASLGVQVSEAFGDVTVEVPATDWVGALEQARDILGLNYFDWLSAVDEQADGFFVVCHLYDPVARRGVLLRAVLTADAPHLATATGIFRGAAWHERETSEMFGINFTGHPHLVPLLLPEGFEGHPLRKDFVLAARAAKAWPGAKEPGESGDATPSRRKTVPPGVPDADEWGPRPPGDAVPHE